MKAMYFYQTYKEPCNNLLNMGNKMNQFFNFLRDSEKFKKWLEYILAFGNYMNGIGFYGGANGFKIDTFNKIIETKSSDDTKTLLQFIIESIHANEKDINLLNFSSDLEIISGSKK